MKKSKVIVVVIALIALVQSVFPFQCFAADISDKSAFEYTITKVEPGSVPGNMQVDLYCQTDPGAAITTLGATLVINTKYVDVVNDEGKAVTAKFQSNDPKVTSIPVGENFTINAAKVGAKKKYSFTGMEALSLTSYNASSGNLYLFICGMAMAGLKLPEKSLICTFYLQSKDAAGFPDGAVRLMEENECGTSCPSKAIYANEISSKQEVGMHISPMTLDIDQALIRAQEEPTTKQEQTTAKPETTSEEATKATTKQSTTATSTTKPVSQMSEEEVEKELKVKVEAEKELKPTEEQKQTAAYKAYKKAIEKAKEVLGKKDATAEQKAEALEEVRKAEQALKEELPALAKQLSEAESRLSMVGNTDAKWWIFLGGSAVLVAAVIMVLIINKKNNKKEDNAQ